MIATNDDRARVAQALREMETPTWPTLTEAVMGHVAGREKVVERLADLIEPSCDATATVTDTSATRDVSQSRRSDVDRGALLALADEMEEDACWEVQSPGDVSGAWKLKDACDRIREALGEG